MPGFNLKSIRQVASAKIQVKDPATGDPTGVIFEMAGPEHPDRKRITFAQSRKFLRSYAKTGRAEMPEPEDAESQKKENLTEGSELHIFPMIEGPSGGILIQVKVLPKP